MRGMHACGAGTGAENRREGGRPGPLDQRATEVFTYSFHLPFRDLKRSFSYLLIMRHCHPSLHRMTAKRLTFYNTHAVSRHAEGHVLLVATITADLPFVNFVYENHLDGKEREVALPSGCSRTVRDGPALAS